MSSRIMSVNDAARYLGLSRSTLDKWRAKRKVLPFYQHGKKVWYTVDDLDEYLRSIRVEVKTS